MNNTLILTCAGKGSRAGKTINKLLVKIDGITCIERAISPFIKTGLFSNYIITSSKDDYKEISLLAKDIENQHSLPNGIIQIVLGGKTRSQSVRNALELVQDGIVIIHDGARPFVKQQTIINTIKSVEETGSGIVAVPSPDTICNGEEVIYEYLGKKNIYKVQTPQGFYAKTIKGAYELADGKEFGDDGEVYKTYIQEPSIVLGEQDNIKITYPEDFDKLIQKEVRFGVGFDCHKLVEGRKLILGGIEIAHDKGLLGHSDADVLTHAIMDAMLSACAMRDIGYWFSDKDPQYKDADSINLLRKVIEIIGKEGYKVESISATIMAEKPKLLTIIPSITENLAKVLEIPTDKVGISATTLEGLGFVGREEGICTHATAVVKR